MAGYGKKKSMGSSSKMKKYSGMGMGSKKKSSYGSKKKK